MFSYFFVKSYWIISIFFNISFTLLFYKFLVFLRLIFKINNKINYYDMIIYNIFIYTQKFWANLFFHTSIKIYIRWKITAIWIEKNSILYIEKVRKKSILIQYFSHHVNSAIFYVSNVNLRIMYFCSEFIDFFREVALFKLVTCFFSKINVLDLYLKN